MEEAASTISLYLCVSQCGWICVFLLNCGPVMQRSLQQPSVPRPAEPAQCSLTFGTPSGHRSAGTKGHQKRRQVWLYYHEAGVLEEEKRFSGQSEKNNISSRLTKYSSNSVPQSTVTKCEALSVADRHPCLLLLTFHIKWLSVSMSLCTASMMRGCEH